MKNVSGNKPKLSTHFIILLIFIGVLTTSFSLKAQICNEDVSLRRQAEINAFACTEIRGSLTISGDDIVDLSPLLGLRKVFRRIVINANPQLRSLKGLDSLEVAQGGLEIANNPVLTSLEGLNQLAFVDQPGLFIINNDALKSLEGLDNLTSISENFVIARNKNLISVDGMDKLETINNSLGVLRADPTLSVTQNPKLMNCCGVNRLTKMVFQGFYTVEDNGPGCTALSNPEGEISNDIFNCVTGLDIKEGSQITLNSTERSTAIRVSSEPSQGLDSMTFDLQGPLSFQSTEKLAPYSIFGNDPEGKLFSKQLPQGDYTLMVVSHPRLDTLMRNFSVVLENPIRLTFVEAGHFPGQSEGLVTQLGEDFTALISPSELSTNAFNVEAFLDNVDIDSVVFDLNGPIQQKTVEKLPPYFLFGNLPDGSARGRNMLPGRYTLRTISYPLLDTTTVRFSIRPSLVNYTLINTDSQDALMTLESDISIDLARIGDVPMNIQANTISPKVDSVKFSLVQNDVVYRQTEKIFPYALFGNDPGNPHIFLGQNLSPGAYRLSIEIWLDGLVSFDQIQFEVVNSNTCEGNFTLSNQSEVDAFNCVEVRGSLTISGEDIQDLSALGQLEKVQGDLTIKSMPLLKNLIGLENLKEIGGSLEMRDLTELTQMNSLAQLSTIGKTLILFNLGLSSLEGLESLKEIGGDLDLQYLKQLTQFKSLSQLSRVGETLRIRDNASLVSLEGLENLNTVKDVVIISNPALTSLNGLQGLSELDRYLTVSSNDQLNSLEGLENLERFENAEIYISQNDKLVSLKGLENIKDFGGPIPFENFFLGGINIRENPILSDVQALANWPYIQGGLRIYDNPELAECCVLSRFIGQVGGTLRIDNNATSCDLEGIQNNCANRSGLVNIQFYPNPTENKINLIADNVQLSKGQIQLYNPQGELIREIPFSNGLNHQLEVRGLLSGVYVLKVISESGEAIQRRILVE